MAKFCVSVFTLFVLFCAGSSAQAQQELEKQIAGNWRCSSAKTRAHLKLPSLASDADEDFLKEVGRIRVAFGSDHSLVVHESEGNEMKGEWKIVKDEDGQIEIELLRDEESTPARLEFLDENTMAVSVKNERTLVLSREVDGPVKGIAAKLVGTWTFDRKASQNLESNKQFDAEHLDGMLREANGMIVTFKDDGSFLAQMTSGEEKREINGNWSSTKDEGDDLAIEVTIDAEHGPDSVTVQFRDDGSILIAPPNEPAAVFVRNTEESK